MISNYDADLNRIVSGFYKMSKTSLPDAPVCQALVEEWWKYLSREHYECSLEMLECLGKMYTDEEFREKIDVFGEGTADFMSRAILVFCESRKKLL